MSPPPPPPEVAVTTQQPDIVIFSWLKMAVLLIELTIPLEDRVMAGQSQKKIAMLLCFNNALKMDGLLVVLQLKWVAGANVSNPCYIILNPSRSQAPYPVNFEISAVVLPIGAVMFSFSEENVLNGPPGQWVSPGALFHLSHTEHLSHQVCRVLFDLCSILPMRDPGSQPVQAASCADISCPISVRAAHVRRVHESSRPRKSVLCKCAHAFISCCVQCAHGHLSKCAHWALLLNCVLAHSFSYAHTHSFNCAHYHSFINGAHAHLFHCAHAYSFHVAHAFSHQYEQHHGLLVCRVCQLFIHHPLPAGFYFFQLYRALFRAGNCPFVMDYMQHTHVARDRLHRDCKKKLSRRKLYSVLWFCLPEQCIAKWRSGCG